MRELLASMEDEVVALDLDRSYSGEALSVYDPVIGDRVIDLTISSQHTLDNALQILQKDGYQIRSIRAKSGRLEEFFIKSTGK